MHIFKEIKGLALAHLKSYQRNVNTIKNEMKSVRRRKKMSRNIKKCVNDGNKFV